MTDLEDPSRARDEVAADTATLRSHNLGGHVQRLSLSLSAFRKELATNTSSTLEIVERQKVTTEIIKGMQSEMQKVDFGKLAEMVDALETMKGGVKVLGWLEGPMKWVTAVAGAVAAVWALYHTWGAK